MRSSREFFIRELRRVIETIWDRNPPRKSKKYVVEYRHSCCGIYSTPGFAVAWFLGGAAPTTAGAGYICFEWIESFHKKIPMDNFGGFLICYSVECAWINGAKTSLTILYSMWKPILTRPSPSFVFINISEITIWKRACILYDTFILMSNCLCYVVIYFAEESFIIINLTWLIIILIWYYR